MNNAILKHIDFCNAFYNYLADIDGISSEVYEYFRYREYLKSNIIYIDFNHWITFHPMNSSVSGNDLRYIVEFNTNSMIELSPDKRSYSDISVYEIDSIFRIFIFTDIASIGLYSDDESVKKIDDLKQIGLLTDDVIQRLSQIINTDDIIQKISQSINIYNCNFTEIEYNGISYLCIINKIFDFCYDNSYYIFIFTYAHDRIYMMQECKKWISIGSIL